MISIDESRLSNKAACDSPLIIKNTDPGISVSRFEENGLIVLTVSSNRGNFKALVSGRNDAIKFQETTESLARLIESR